METEKLKLAVLFQLEWRLTFIEGGLVAHLPSWGTALMVLERERERNILVTGLWNFWMRQRIRSIRWFSIWDPSSGLCHYVLRRAMVSQKPKGIAEPHSWRLEVGELRSIIAIECMIVPCPPKATAWMSCRFLQAKPLSHSKFAVWKAYTKTIQFPEGHCHMHKCPLLKYHEMT